jgi:hypothetical protein
MRDIVDKSFESHVLKNPVKYLDVIKNTNLRNFLALCFDCKTSMIKEGDLLNHK